MPENYDEPLPPIRSERPVWDANHPDHIALAEEHPKAGAELAGAGAGNGRRPGGGGSGGGSPPTRIEEVEP